MTRYLLIGGGLASAEAAKAIRQQDKDGEITLVGGERHLPYDRPPLTKEFMRGEKPAEKLPFYGADFYAENRVKTLLGIRAESVDLLGKSVALSNGQKATFDKLLLATGGTPNRLPVPGVDLPGVHYLRTQDDSAAIQAEAQQGKRAVIIGSGFIGIEAASSLAQRGVKVTVVEAQPQIWPRFANKEIAGYFKRYCEAKGVAFLTGEQVTQIKGGRRVTSVATKSGKNLPCDFVCIAIGIRPNVELAEAAGLKVDNGVVVDSHLRSSHPDVFAAGDIANYPDPIFNSRRRVEHWGQAEYMGQIAGKNIAGGDAPYDLLTYVWSEIFNLHLEFAGDESSYDQMVLRGRFQDDSFTVLYLMKGAMRAYFAVNADKKAFPLYERAIRDKRDLSKAVVKLQDATSNLNVVLRKRPTG